ncbi:hypothetical protein H0266_10785 [Halobacillus locisalis]|uniref:Uncharacterized protein n=1 Tax=Halobacillus locisalis TaxID=220753 RepID=A0A838CUA2_9BACI|nr:hypothetical protein [Halobacillus locisalis]MBA2175379.1 hypothetical protein [Halobacillus locisalis]
MTITKENLQHIQLAEPLQHLSISELNELLEDYYSLKVKDVIEKYKLSISPSSLYNILPPHVTRFRCTYCGKQMLQKRKTKSSSPFAIDKAPVCPVCAYENSKRCKCSKCLEISRQLQIEEKRIKTQLINAVHSSPIPVEEFELTLTTKYYLAVLLRLGLSEDMSIIYPVHSYQQKLSPTPELNREVLIYLINERVITPDPSSEIQAFSKENFPRNFYIHQVHYQLNISPPDGNKSEMYKRLLYPEREIFLADIDWSYDMWIRVAKGEVLEFLDFQLKKLNFVLNSGDKTHKVIENLLESYSTGQICSLIYSAVNNASRRYQEGSIPKKRAANSVVTLMESYGGKDETQSWEVRSFSRNYNLTESSMSEVLFNSILRIGDLGFHIPPSRNL